MNRQNLRSAAAAALVAALGFGAAAVDDQLRRDAAAASAARSRMQTGLIDLLEFNRLVQEYPHAIGTGLEQRRRERLESALRALRPLPDELAALAAGGHRTGNAVLIETTARARAEIEADLRSLAGLFDRMITQDSQLGAKALARRITVLLTGRMMPELSLPQLVLETEHDRLERRRNEIIGTAVGLAGLLMIILVAVGIPWLMRGQRQKLREARAALDKAAVTDPVTRLPNRRATHQFLEALPAGQPVLIMVFEFAPAFGLPDGDEAQIALGVAAAMGKRLRDLEGDALFLGQAREGQFCIVLPTLDKGHGGFIQQRDLDSLADEPVQLDHRRVRLVFRAGIAIRRPHRPALAALQNASVALDQARELRAMQPMVYRPAFRRQKIADQRVAREFRVALMSGEVRPHFQPQIDLRTGAVAGMEALARWHHPQRGLLPPAAFLPQAQRTGLDEPLGEVMLRMGLEALLEWDAQGLHVPAVGVNAAESQLNNPRFPDFVKWELDRQRIAPERLAIEVLESVYAASDDDPIVRNLRRLAELGVRIELDDFGTGAASIMGMRRYQATRIKIDRSFVRDINNSPSNWTLLSTMVQMARNMDLEALAEGVETPAERARLTRLGCDFIQGYGVARPMPLADTFGWLAQRQSDLPRAGGRNGRSSRHATPP